MEEQDELFYLQPGFDLNSLRVPQLRSILVSQNVPYPSSAKKQELIDVVQAEIVPKARKLLSNQARVRRTSKGITDVPSSQEESTVDEEEDDDRALMPPPSTRTPRSRKSKSNMTDEPAVPKTPSTVRRSKTPTSRRTTSKHVRSSDTETDPEIRGRFTRKVRKSAPAATSAGSAIKIEEPEMPRSRGTETSPFSDDNPFQAGSSPPSGTRRKSSSRGRQSLSAIEGRKSASKGRAVTTPSTNKQKGDHVVPSRSTFEFPVTRIGSSGDMDVTEEFTPDAAQELKQEETANGQLVRQRNSALYRRPKQPASTAAKITPAAILASVLALLATWYRQEKIDIGYCGVGKPNWSLAQYPNIPDSVHENLQPACEPCPQHAVCFPGMQVECEPNFVLNQHPLSLYGIVPLPPTCEPDSEKEKRIKRVADRAVDELRERRAAYECGDDVESVRDGATSVVTSVHEIVKSGASKLEIPEETLKAAFNKVKRPGMTDQEFDDLWRPALSDIMSREEIEVVRDRSGAILLSSSSLAKLPFTCAIRRSLVRKVAENRLAISLLVLILASIAYGRQMLVNYRHASAQIPMLVSTTLDRLATQAALKEDGRVAEGFISVGQLRDDVLRNVFSARERERVWQGVRKIVESNSNVRAATREGGKTGEWARVWEWIGPVDLAPGLEGRRSGGLIADSPGKDLDGMNGSALRKWDEGRALY